MALEWKLRKVMAEKNIWSGAELSSPGIVFFTMMRSPSSV